ncbi:ATP-binding protein [Actinoplanes sp. DH11]|uniref:hybrid sensor histidine kinase/response regulator n=1 Tax=Actinoplanes sp. DH11 TaxID=2857011 RepID=UPI001E4F9A38|nr:ATP-binding protein [Actinoplanes sp. DH11]
MASVVVAEDNVEHQRLLGEILQRLNHDMIMVSDGRAALAAIRARRPDLVIADVDMPHLDGVQLCRALREDPDLASTPVVLVTAYLPAGDPDLSAAGATVVVRKPFKVRHLMDVVQRCLDTGATDLVNAPGFVEALLYSLDVGVCVCDPQGRLLLLNKAMRALFGDDSAAVPLSEWSHRFTLRHLDGTPLPAPELPLSRALAGETVERADMFAYDLHRRPRWLVVNAHPLRDPGGTLIGAVAAVHDVTADHQAHLYQRCKSAVLEVLARAPDTGTAAAEVLRVMNAQLGWPYLRLWLVDPVSDRLLPAAVFAAPDAQALPMPANFERGHGLAGLCWLRGESVWVPDIHAPGSPVLPDIARVATYHAAGAVPVHGGSEVAGVLTYFSYDRQEPEPALVVLMTGIAGHIGAYLERRRAEELAQQLAASIEEYVALVGHELRTPLTSIAACTDLITQEPDATPLAEFRDLLEVVVRNNDRLLALVDQLLDLTALESGHVTINAEAVDLAGIVAAVVDGAQDATAGRHIDIDTALPDRLTVPGDRDRLRQAVDHLVDNAVRYSPDHSGITVTLTASESVAVLAITNLDSGVPAEEHPQLLRRLYRGSNARHSGIPGTGLGLTLSRAIVDRHHGTLTITPQEPSGTTVTVRLPRTTG